MEGSTLNVAAPVFQPGRPLSISKPTTEDSVDSQVPATSDQNGGRVLSQIQNQMAPGDGAPGGTVHLNARTRPFVPGGGASFNAPKPEVTPMTSHQVDQTVVPTPSRTPLPFHRLGHSMNPGSVQLTGLPAFLATPPVMNHIPPSPGFAGPPSPLSANGSASGSVTPFFAPHGQMQFGLPRPTGPANSSMQYRKSKGLPPVTPLKTTGHNSKPSISLNPASFMANLAALKAKKKVVVSMPVEAPLPDDAATLVEAKDGSIKEGAEPGEVLQEGEFSNAFAAKRRQARAAASTRQKWSRRQPWPADQHDLVQCSQLPPDATVTCAVHPEPWPYSRGLPDTIEIYLPGASAWDEFYETALEEPYVAPENDEQFVDMLPLRQWPWLPADAVASDADTKARSLSISTPADPAMVTFKLNRYLQSQQASKADSVQALKDGFAGNEDEVEAPFSRLGADLTNRLREAFERRRGDSADFQLRPLLKHNQTMSLCMPSSGGPFGPEVFSALDMIRANSDEGPSKPPSEASKLPEKPLSDSEAMIGASAPYLDDITEDDAEHGAEADSKIERHNSWMKTASGNWKDLGRGFGYDPDSQTAENGRSRKHARKTSRISVSTSRGDGAEIDESLEDEDAEIRTNPSEDADASDFEEELAEYGPEHWHARRPSAHLSAFGDVRGRHAYEDEASDFEDEDSLLDSLTPSDEQFSNPSDEEAAREERSLRRQARAAKRAARREPKAGRRDRDNADNTLPSSSIGEADLHERGGKGFQSGPRYWVRSEQEEHAAADEIVSNPSDEVQSDFDDSQTFGRGTPAKGTEKASARLSQDFRFPPPKPVATYSQDRAEAPHRPPMSSTLGRASGISLLNPDAKEFKLGASSASRTVSVPVTTSETTQEAERGHFRLPSIKNSSFGSSALGDRAANAPHLNVGAATFTPGAFTFKTSQQLQVPEVSRPVSPSIAAPENAGVSNDEDRLQREEQGREKRTRYGPLDYGSDDDRYAMYSTRPPRPRASAASIEGPLRIFSTLARKGPPPFLPAGYSQQQRAVSHESAFTANGPSFVPSWAAAASFKRPALPDWSLSAQAASGQTAIPSIRDPTFFMRESGSKAIPIRRPSEGDHAAATAQHSSAAPQKITGEGGVTAAPAPQQEKALQGQIPDANRKPTEAVKATGPFPDAGSLWPIQPARPMHIPAGPHSYQSSSLLLASNASPGPSIRWGHRSATSRSSMSSIGRHLRRTDRRGDDDDESLTDFVDEIVERVDKALEGWTGKILDEVTIMGQVRPHPRNGDTPAESSFDQDKVVQALSRRMEEVLDIHLASSFGVHSRMPTNSSDGTQTTIRAASQRGPAPTDDNKVAASGLVDGSGEWDFDYVQEVLDAKLNGFRKHIETTMMQVLEKLSPPAPAVASAKQEANGESHSSSSSLSNLAEVVSTRLMVQLESILEEFSGAAKERQAASDTKLQSAMQTKLDENLFLLSEKGATERASLQQMLESEIHGLERSISQVGGSVQEQLESALKTCMPPLLEESALIKTTMTDQLASQLEQALGPSLSEQRSSLLEEHQKSRAILLEAMPSSSSIAQSTVSLVEPLVRSLKTDPIDSGSLVTRLAEVIGKQSIEHLVDLSPVLALLEPLIVKHEDARAFSKKILQRQEDTERTLSELPGAINAKTEIFLSSASETSAKQADILTKVEEIRAEMQRQAVDAGDLDKKLEDLSQDKTLTRETAEKTLSELAEVYQVLNASYEALSRLEAQQASSDESHKALMARLETQAEASAKMAEQLREAEARAIRAEAGQSELAAKLSASDKESTMLRDQLAGTIAELAAAKAEKMQEREASTKALAEAVVRSERAESANTDLQDRLRRSLEQANVAEREAYDSAYSVLERASKAEGQVAALEKRVSEQDDKIATLQQLTATQKQKAAQSQQKLAEGEKRVKDLETRAARLGVLEGKEVELEETRRRLQESEESEARAVEEMKRYDERFRQMERDLVQIQENFVPRGVWEETVMQLCESEELVEQLRGQIARTAEKQGAWSSMHAPRVRVEDHSDTSAELVGRANGSTRSVSLASTGSVMKEVQVDEGGWWT